MLELAPPKPPRRAFPSLARGPFPPEGSGEIMPKKMTVQSVEVGLRRCRTQAAALDDRLLLYLIDITLLHLRRKAARPETAATASAIRGGCGRMFN